MTLATRPRLRTTTTGTTGMTTPSSPSTRKTDRLPPRRPEDDDVVVRLQLLPLLPLRLEDTGVAPKTLFPRVHPNPNPLYLYALFSKCHLSYNLSYHHVALHLVGSG